MQQEHHDVQRIPERYLSGDVTLKELLAYLESIQPVEHNVNMGDYLTLTDWLVKLADVLDIPEKEEQP